MKLPPIPYRSIILSVLAPIMAAGLSACSVGSSTSISYSVGGTVSGLGSGKSVVLQNNKGDDLTVSANGSFSFATRLLSGGGYDVTVLTQPTDQTCTVGNGTGAVFGADITDVTVNCTTATHTVGGIVTGLGSSKSLVLQNNGGDDLTVTADGGFTFTTPLEDGAAYNVTVLTPPPQQSCTVSNASGAATSDISSVAVVCRDWGGTALIETDNAGDATAPQVAMDSDGNAVAVWTQSDGSPTTVWANRYLGGSGWLTPIRIDNDDTNGASLPQIAMDGSGDAMAVWVQKNEIRTRRYTAGVGWGVVATIGSSGIAATPHITLDSSGDAVAVWTQTDSTPTQIWANHYIAGWGWGTATTIGDGSGDADAPRVAADDSGDVMAVWQQSDGTRTNIWASRYTVGGGWGTAALIETNNAGSASSPEIATAGNGDATAVWQQSNGSVTSIWANRYTAGTGWGGAGLIEHDDTGNATTPQVAIDGGGNAVAVWSQSDGSVYSIWANRFATGGGWGTAALIEHDDSGDALLPEIAVGANGNAVSVWQQSDGIRPNIWTNRYTAGGGWDAAELLETDNTGDAKSPQVAVGGNDQAAAVWSQFDGARYNIEANVYW
jgi:hypothetical protein